MYELRSRARFGLEYILVQLLISVTSIGLAAYGLVLFSRHFPPPFPSGAWYCLAAIPLGLVAGLVAHVRVLRSFRCPECRSREHISRHVHDADAEAEAARLVYRCSACRIDWDTHLRRGAGDDVVGETIDL